MTSERDTAVGVICRGLIKLRYGALDGFFEPAKDSIEDYFTLTNGIFSCRGRRPDKAFACAMRFAESALNWQDYRALRGRLKRALTIVCAELERPGLVHRTLLADSSPIQIEMMGLRLESDREALAHIVAVISDMLMAVDNLRPTGRKLCTAECAHEAQP